MASWPPERDGSGPIRPPHFATCLLMTTGNRFPWPQHWYISPFQTRWPVTPYFKWFFVLILICVLWVYFCPCPIIPAHEYHHFPSPHSFFPSWWSRLGQRNFRGGMSSFSWKLGPAGGRPPSAGVAEPRGDKKGRFPRPIRHLHPPPPPHDSLSLDPSTRPSTSNLNPFVSLWLKPGLLYQRCYRGQRPRWVWIPLLWEGTSRRWTGVQAPCEMRERGSVDVMPNSCWAQSSHSPSDVFFFFSFYHESTNRVFLCVLTGTDYTQNEDVTHVKALENNKQCQHRKLQSTISKTALGWKK